MLLSVEAWGGLLRSKKKYKKTSLGVFGYSLTLTLQECERPKPPPGLTTNIKREEREQQPKASALINRMLRAREREEKKIPHQICHELCETGLVVGQRERGGGRGEGVYCQAHIPFATDNISFMTEWKLHSFHTA